MDVGGSGTKDTVREPSCSTEGASTEADGTLTTGAHLESGHAPPIAEAHHAITKDVMVGPAGRASPSTGGRHAVALLALVDDLAALFAQLVHEGRLTDQGVDHD
jgi:hypothetical protein